MPTRLQGKRKRRALTLLEVMIASVLGLGITVTSISSIVYYQKTTFKNDRLARLNNMMEGQMERLLGYTWYDLSQGTGIFPPGGGSSATWPARTGPFTRYEATKLKVPLLDDTTLNGAYTGLNGTIQVFYTPFWWSHIVETGTGAQVAYDVQYYKVELVVTLAEGSRIRPKDPANPTAPDVWTMVTYLSELRGQSDATFSNLVLDTLRSRQRPVT